MKPTAVLLATALSLATLPALAQDYPDRPITLIAPFAAGGTSDSLARTIAAELEAQLGQQVIVENQPGAGGTIGLAKVAKAEPDGYTIGLGGAGSLVHSAGIFKDSIGFDVRSDFAPIGLLGTSPVVAVASPKLGLTDVAGLTTLAQQSEGEVAYGTAGVGGAMHLAAEVYQREAGIRMLHVPYKGVAPAMTDFLGGQIDVGFFDATAVLPQMDSGAMTVLGVASAERTAQLPDVPTFAEQGLKDVVVEIWYGLVAPAGTPQPVIDRLAAATEAAVAGDKFTKTLDTFGFRPMQSGPQAMADLIASDLEFWLPVIEEAGITAQ